MPRTLLEEIKPSAGSFLWLILSEGIPATAIVSYVVHLTREIFKSSCLLPSLLLLLPLVVLAVRCLLKTSGLMSAKSSIINTANRKPTTVRTAGSRSNRIRKVVRLDEARKTLLFLILRLDSTCPNKCQPFGQQS